MGKKYYEVEVGILLDPEDREFDAYKMDGVYDGEHSFYDENQYAFDADEFEEHKQKLIDNLNKCKENSYVIIKGPFDLDGAESVDDVEEFSYDINDVIFSAYKDKEGNIVEDFLKVNESLDEGKTVQTKKQLDDDVYVEYSFDDKKYYLASDYDRYVWTNFNSIEDAESFYKYHKNDVRNSILEEKLEEGKKQMKYEISYIDSDGHEVNNQIFTAEGVSGHLKNLEEWGCKNIVVKSLEEVEETLTEAPDDDGIMNDDELDAEEQRERDEMEARFKARRDKVAQQRADRDAKIARQNELKALADKKLTEIGDDWSFEHLFDILVPNNGKCESLAGELVRAANKIEYRWFNDGDRFFEDYGIHTCGQPAYFLMNFELDDDTPLWDFMIDWAESDADNDDYDAMLEDLKNKVIAIVKEHPELLATETIDMYDIASKDEVEEFFDDHDMIPKYDIDCSIPPELQSHLDKGNISERDLMWEVESWIENIGDAKYSDVSIDWGNVYVNDCNKSVYMELDGGSTLYNWLEDYARELTDEYGDPDEEEQEEESEEEGEEDEER